MTLPQVPRLMLVTNRHSARMPLPELARIACAHGVDAVQVREKDLETDALTDLAREVAAASSCSVTVNGAPGVALAVGCGLHLPEAAGPDAAWRSQLGTGVLLGRSVHSPQSARDSAGFDYVIAGHVHETSSKSGLAPLGLDGLNAICVASPAPVLAIGGIAPARVPGVLRAGARGVAVMSGINDAADPAEAAIAYRQGIERWDQSMQHDSEVEATVNGKPVRIPAGTTVATFLHGRGQHERLVVVEQNGVILRKDDFAQRTISAGDVLEIVHFVGGG